MALGMYCDSSNILVSSQVLAREANVPEFLIRQLSSAFGFSISTYTVVDILSLL